MNATRTILQIDEVIGLIKQNYSNLDIREVKLYARGINEYYTVLAKDKPSTNQDEQRFFLRISPADRLVDFSREHYSTEVNLINHLNSHNFPTVEIVPRIDGKGLGEIKKNTGSIYYILFKELVGTPLIEKGLSNPLTFDIGKQLATFHIITSELSDLHRPECGTQFLVEYLGPQIQKFLADRPGDWAVVEKILTKIPDILNNARDKEYPHGLIHGDFQGNNILVKDDKIIIFDFDYSFKGFQIMDIANFTLYLGAASPENADKLAVSFLNGYRSVLSTYEITYEMIKSFELVKSVMYLGIFANRAKRLGKEAYEFWLNALLEYLHRTSN